MAINPRNRGPVRTLAALIVIVFGLYGLLAAVSTWGDAQRTPKLGLDLEGGTQLILQPKIVGNQKINEGQIQKAVDIIRARVDGSGVAEAEVTTQGATTSWSRCRAPPDAATVNSLQKSSQLRIRPASRRALPHRHRSPRRQVHRPANRRRPPPPRARRQPGPQPRPAPPPAKSGYPPALAAATTPAPTVRAPATAPAKATPGATANPTTAPTGKPKDASDLAWVTPDVEAAYTALDCANPKDVEAIVDDPAKPMVTCSADGAKYILGPAEVLGSDITNATFGQETGTNGVSTGKWEVVLSPQLRGRQGVL